MFWVFFYVFDYFLETSQYFQSHNLMEYHYYKEHGWITAQ